MWIVSLPLQVAQRGAASPQRSAGSTHSASALWLVGMFFESVGDAQLARFKADPANAGRVMDRGLWRYTRHPNYFGDCVVWWGLFAIALGGAGRCIYAIVGPIVMTVLLRRVSGVTLLERSLVKRRSRLRGVRRAHATRSFPARRAVRERESRRAFAALAGAERVLARRSSAGGCARTRGTRGRRGRAAAASASARRSQPRPTAAYRRRNTSTPSITSVPSGSTPWMRLITAALVEPVARGVEAGRGDVLERDQAAPVAAAQERDLARAQRALAVVEHLDREGLAAGVVIVTRASQTRGRAGHA